MRLRFTELLISVALTLALLLALEVVGTTFLPLFGLVKYRLPFNVLLALFLAFRVNSPFVAIMIMILQYLHSFFSIEGWGMGTLIGVIVAILISYLRELIHFTTHLSTILVTQAFQVVLFLIFAFFMYVKMDNWSYLFDRTFSFVFESFAVSLMAPFFFAFLDRVWHVDKRTIVED